MQCVFSEKNLLPFSPFSSVPAFEKPREIHGIKLLESDPRLYDYKYNVCCYSDVD